MPAYNEADNLPYVINRIEEFCTYSRITNRSIIVVDDGSSDHTAQVISELRHDYDLDVVTHAVNQGYGAALRTGLNAALDSGHDWIAFCDSDGQFDPMDTGRLLEAIYANDADVAIGYREQRADNWHRRVIGQLWHWLSSLVLGYKAVDVDCGFKVFSRRSIKEIAPQLCGEYATISPEILTRLQLGGFTIVEEPVPHYPRTNGQQTGTDFHVIWNSLVGLFKVRTITRKATSVYDINTEYISV